MDGLDWTASAMRAARAQLDIATHNLANASDGYLKCSPIEVRVDRSLCFVWAMGTITRTFQRHS
jgi:flagellar hook protein FlgE